MDNRHCHNPGIHSRVPVADMNEMGVLWTCLSVFSLCYVVSVISIQSRLKKLEEKIFRKEPE